MCVYVSVISSVFCVFIKEVVLGTLLAKGRLRCGCLIPGQRRLHTVPIDIPRGGAKPMKGAKRGRGSINLQSYLYVQMSVTQQLNSSITLKLFKGAGGHHKLVMTPRGHRWYHWPFIPTCSNE